MDETKKKILVVEDEKSLSNLLAKKLEQEGFQATTAYNGQEAMQILSSQQFDLILLDLLMPGMDGFEVLKRLNSKNVRTPVLVLSNLSQMEDKEKAKSLGAREYFVKAEVPLAQVVERVKSYLGSPSVLLETK